MPHGLYRGRLHVVAHGRRPATPTTPADERSGRNPRRIKRLINSFVLEYHLNHAWHEIGVENLVKVIMLQNFYLSFYRILIDPRGDDPVRDFLVYQDFRSNIKQHSDEWKPEKWRDLFVVKDIGPPDRTSSHDNLISPLASLEEELPVEFPALAADRDFVALVRSFDGSSNSDQLRRLLGKTVDAEAGRVLRRDARPKGRPGQRNAGPVDRRSARNAPDGQRSPSPQGADLVLATGRTSALEALVHAKPAVVLSDFTRDGNVNAGLEDLAYFREQHLYAGPVIFCFRNGNSAR
jgi:hypothetical protein